MIGEDRELDRKLGYLLLRVTLGMNILMHGASRIGAGVDRFAGSLVAMFQHTVLPAAMVSAFGHALPFLETLVGLLVTLGLWTRYALGGGALLMIVLTFGSTLRQDWNAAGLQLPYSIVFALLLVLREWNGWSFDGLRGKSNRA